MTADPRWMPRDDPRRGEVAALLREIDTDAYVIDVVVRASGGLTVELWTAVSGFLIRYYPVADDNASRLGLLLSDVYHAIFRDEAHTHDENDNPVPV